MDDKHTIDLLIVDDNPINQEIIMEYLDGTGYVFETADDGAQALQKLEARPGYYDVVLLDRMMPGMDGVEVLRKIKTQPLNKLVPVILQTAKSSREDILEGMRAGAFYYLTKPFEEDMLRSVVSTAVQDRLNYRRLQRELNLTTSMLLLMRSAEFVFQKPQQARDIASLLANVFPDPRRAVIGLAELLLNAVEHGNLGITYDEKGRLQQNDAWHQEISDRLARPEYAERFVRVIFHNDPEYVGVTIVDQGDGFDWHKYLEMDPGRAFDTHGRGIAMSRMVSFDSMEYRGKGNEVEVRSLRPAKS